MGKLNKMTTFDNPLVSTNQKPVFGTSLIEYAEQANRDLSIVLEYCLCILNENLIEEGLFRVPGSSSKVKKLKSFFNLQTYQMIQEHNNNQLNGNENQISSSNSVSSNSSSNAFYLANLDNYDEYVTDPHSVAGCLKAFFRELPEPLFVFAIYDDLVQCAGITNTNERLTALWNIVNGMPSAHIENLRYLIKFFAKLAANSDVNKMTAQNIAIAISPSLIWQPTPSTSDGNSSPNSTTLNQMSFGLDMCSANQYGIIIETLIMYSDWFFPGDEINFDSLKSNKQQQRRQSTDSQTGTTKLQQTPAKSTQQTSPKSQSRSSSIVVNNNNKNSQLKDRNPLPTPRMSTRSKKQPAPIPPISKALNQSDGNHSGLNLSNQNLNFNTNENSSSNQSNFVTNSPFLLKNHHHPQNNYDFQAETKNQPADRSPTLKSFERKGSFQDQIVNSKCKKQLMNTNGSNSSSGTGSKSNSQDSVNSLNSNKLIDNQQQLHSEEQEQQKFNLNMNCSNDSLLSSNSTAAVEPNYQNLIDHFKLSSSSSENLDHLPNTNNLSSTPRPAESTALSIKKVANQNQTITTKTDFNSLIGGSLDRQQLSQLRNERSRQNPSRPRASNSNRGSTTRPSSIPPEPPIKPRSHDNLLLDESESVRFSNLKKNEIESNATTSATTTASKNEPDKRFNLKLDVKGKDYKDDEIVIDNDSFLVSYVKINEDENEINQRPEKPKRQLVNSPPPFTKSSTIPPPIPPVPTIFKSSKSLMNEHTYL